MSTLAHEAPRSAGPAPRTGAPPLCGALAHENSTERRPDVLSVGVVDESPLIVHGLRALLEPAVPGLRVLSRESGAVAGGRVDLTLFDPASPLSGAAATLLGLLAEPRRGPVLLFSFGLSPARVGEWLAVGCAGFVDKRAPADQLVETVTALVGGPRRGGYAARADAAPARPPDRWPGQEHGLSRRESQMMYYIARGVSNQDIGTHLALSTNTVKTYVRSAYGKVGVTRRPEAVRWGVQHGMLESTLWDLLTAGPSAVGSARSVPGT